MDKKVVAKRVAVIVANVLIYTFLVVCLFGVSLTLTAKRDADGTVTMFGMQMRYVLSPSMEKCDATYDQIKQYEIKDIPTKSMVFIETVPKDKEAAKEWYEALKVGDVLTFKYVYARQETITHRITEIKPKLDGSGFIINLAGDNTDSDNEKLTQVIDTSIPESPDYIIGKVVGQNYPLGVFVQALNTPIGMVCIIILPALIILLVELIKVINLFSAKKRKKEEKIREEQEEELAELKRRLAELESGKPTETPREAPAEVKSESETKSEPPTEA